jgi:hypothetical protein
MNGQQNNQGSGPDISINKVIYLLDSKSIINSIGNQKNNIIEDENPTRVQLKNKAETQYLILYHLAGSNTNSFNMFEVGYLSHRDKTFLKTDFTSFISGNGIRLGISKEALIRIIGKNYIKKQEKGLEIIEYRIDGRDNFNMFLDQYNMPMYSADYYFKNDKLVKFIFGFPYL